MADIALVTAGMADVEEHDQKSAVTAPLAVDMSPLTFVKFDAATGKWVKATTADARRVCYITLRGGKAGDAVTAAKKGVVGGLDLSALAYGAQVYSSANAGALATDVSAGDEVGHVVPVWHTPIGTVPDKLLSFDLSV